MNQKGQMNRKETSLTYQEEKMAKSKTVFVCNSCGYESAKWLGKCPACNEWNSFYEEKLVKENDGSFSQDKRIKSAKPSKLNSVEGKEETRTSTGIGELDRVLGGGIVKGSLVLLRWRTWYWKVYFNSSNL